METENNSQAPSPFDRAYQKYQNGIVIRETGFSRGELPRAIMEGKVRRDQIGRIKSELIVPNEDFFDYYYCPKVMNSKIEPKEIYQDDLIVDLEDRIVSAETFIDGTVIVGCENRLFKIDNQDGVVINIREIDNCNGIKPTIITLLSNGDILYGGLSGSVIRICLLHQKDDGSYLKKDLPKISISKNNAGLSCIIAQPNGKILVESEDYDIDGIGYTYFKYELKNGDYELKLIDDIFDSDLYESRYSQDDSRGIYYNIGGYELEVYSEKNKCLRKIETVGPVRSANLLPNGNIIYATGNKIRILK